MWMGRVLAFRKTWARSMPVPLLEKDGSLCADRGNQTKELISCLAELFTCLLIRSINCILCNSTIDCEALCGLGGGGCRAERARKVKDSCNYQEGQLMGLGVVQEGVSSVDSKDKVAGLGVLSHFFV